MSSLTANDVLEELNEENKRLLNELLFADKCLKILLRFKKFVDFISVQFVDHLESEVWHKYEELTDEVNGVLDPKPKTSSGLSTAKDKVDATAKTSDTTGRSREIDHKNDKQKLTAPDETAEDNKVNEKNESIAEELVQKISEEVEKSAPKVVVKNKANNQITTTIVRVTRSSLAKSAAKDNAPEKPGEEVSEPLDPNEESMSQQTDEWQALNNDNCNENKTKDERLVQQVVGQSVTEPTNDSSVPVKPCTSVDPVIEEHVDKEIILAKDNFEKIGDQTNTMTNIRLKTNDNEPKRFFCSTCGISYAQKQMIDLHIKFYHPNATIKESLNGNQIEVTKITINLDDSDSSKSTQTRPATDQDQSNARSLDIRLEENSDESLDICDTSPVLIDLSDEDMTPEDSVVVSKVDNIEERAKVDNSDKVDKVEITRVNNEMSEKSKRTVVVVNTARMTRSSAKKTCTVTKEDIESNSDNSKNGSVAGQSIASTSRIEPNIEPILDSLSGSKSGPKQITKEDVEVVSDNSKKTIVVSKPQTSKTKERETEVPKLNQTKPKSTKSTATEDNDQSGREIKCLFVDCNETFDISFDYLNHLMTHSMAKPKKVVVVCHKCNKQFNSSQELSAHTDKDHPIVVTKIKAKTKIVEKTKVCDGKAEQDDEEPIEVLVEEQLHESSEEQIKINHKELSELKEPEEQIKEVISKESSLESSPKKNSEQQTKTIVEEDQNKKTEIHIERENKSNAVESNEDKVEEVHRPRRTAARSARKKIRESITEEKRPDKEVIDIEDTSEPFVQPFPISQSMTAKTIRTYQSTVPKTVTTSQPNNKIIVAITQSVVTKPVSTSHPMVTKTVPFIRPIGSKPSLIQPKVSLPLPIQATVAGFVPLITIPQITSIPKIVPIQPKKPSTVVSTSTAQLPLVPIQTVPNVPNLLPIQIPKTLPYSLPKSNGQAHGQPTPLAFKIPETTSSEEAWRLAQMISKSIMSKNSNQMNPFTNVNTMQNRSHVLKPNNPKVANFQTKTSAVRPSTAVSVSQLNKPRVVVSTGVKRPIEVEKAEKSSSGHSILRASALSTGYPIKCPFFGCSQSFMTTNSFEEHRKHHSGIIANFICGQCRQAFETMELLSAHTKQSHPQKRLIIHDLSGHSQKKRKVVAPIESIDLTDDKDEEPNRMRTFNGTVPLHSTPLVVKQQPPKPGTGVLTESHLKTLFPIPQQRLQKNAIEDNDSSSEDDFDCFDIF